MERNARSVVVHGSTTNLGSALQFGTLRHLGLAPMIWVSVARYPSINGGVRGP